VHGAFHDQVGVCRRVGGADEGGSAQHVRLCVKRFLVVNLGTRLDRRAQRRRAGQAAGDV
jgi:hypothetical protein